MSHPRRPARAARVPFNSAPVALGAALAVAFAATPARAEPAPRPYRLSLGLDGALLAAGLASYGAARIATASLDGPACFPCDPDGINAVDRLALGMDSEVARAGSGLGLYAVMAGAVAGDLVDILVTRRGFAPGEAAADMTVLLEVYLLNKGITNLVKAAARRPRQAAYLPERHPEAGADPQNERSFYSGHASDAFALAVAASATYARRHPRGKGRWIVLGAALALASTTAVLRVAGGRHFPSDVMVGAAAGSAVGLAVPWLHERGLAVGPGTVIWRW